MADGNGAANTGQQQPTSPSIDPSKENTEQLELIRNRGRGQYGCRHYRRRVKFITPCCDEVWWCRHCHNETHYQQEEDWSKKHELDRKKITEVVCALCETRQPVGVNCVNCGVDFGAYACTQCPFYDDDLSKETYHCNECGICRVGGRENYFHCNTCGSCYAANLKNNHVCVERAMHQNCPVCFEFLFESVDPTTVLRCGHTIHSQCLRELERNANSICPCCPICKKSLGDYTRYWRAIDREIARTPVPSEYRGWKADILCNDCSTSSVVDFSLIAHKCTACGSYNTRRMGIDTGTGVLDDTAVPVPHAEPAAAAAAAAAGAALAGVDDAVGGEAAQAMLQAMLGGGLFGAAANGGGGNDDEEEEEEDMNDGDDGFMDEEEEEEEEWQDAEGGQDDI